MVVPDNDDHSGMDETQPGEDILPQPSLVTVQLIRKPRSDLRVSSLEIDGTNDKMLQISHHILLLENM